MQTLALILTPLFGGILLFFLNQLNAKSLKTTGFVIGLLTFAQTLAILTEFNFLNRSRITVRGEYALGRKRRHQFLCRY